MIKEKQPHPWYSFDRIMSYNAFFNFVCGGRGLGKTYGAKKTAISKGIKSGGEEQFIYLRRFKDELKAARDTFFADIAHEYPGYDFRINSKYAQYAPAETRDEKKREWITIGYFIALSTAQSQKSVAFPKVTAIIFDEFIIERGMTHYLPNESVVFNNFYSTVDRWQDKTRVFFLANAVSIDNPYFLAYEIRPDESKPLQRYMGGYIAAHFPDSAEFATSVYKTRFGQFIKDSEYADYAIGNEFKDNNDNLIKRKTSKAKYAYTLEMPKGKFSVWYDSIDNIYFAQAKLPKDQVVFTVDPARMDHTKILMLRSDKMHQMLRSAFKLGRLYFDEPSTRNSLVDIFKT